MRMLLTNPTLTSLLLTGADTAMPMVMPVVMAVNNFIFKDIKSGQGLDGLAPLGLKRKCYEGKRSLGKRKSRATEYLWIRR